MKRFDVLTIGLQVIDLMIPGMDGHILDREMTLLDHAELTLGGDALNQAIVLSQLGARTALMGAAGWATCCCSSSRAIPSRSLTGASTYRPQFVSF